MKVVDFILFVGLIIIGQVVSWLQLNLQFVDNKYKNNHWILLSGILSVYIFIQSTRLGVSCFNGKLWPQRIVGFSIGIIVYSVLSKIILNESFDLKTIVCLLLSFIIVLIQVLWK